MGVRLRVSALCDLRLRATLPCERAMPYARLCWVVATGRARSASSRMGERALQPHAAAIHVNQGSASRLGRPSMQRPCAQVCAGL